MIAEKHPGQEVWNKECVKCKSFYRGDSITGLSKYFYRDSSRSDGLSNKCKECFKLKKQSAESVRRRNKRRERKDFLKVKARRAVSSALRSGKIKKSSECNVCKTSNERIEAHHRDYSKPLEIEWLCRKCHVDLHRREGSAF